MSKSKLSAKTASVSPRRKKARPSRQRPLKGNSHPSCYDSVFFNDQPCNSGFASLSTVLEHNQLLRLAASSARIGYFIVDRNTRETKWSIPLFELFEFPPGKDPVREGFFQRCIHPADYPIVKQAFEDALAGKYSQVTYRIHTSSGKKKTLCTSFSGIDDSTCNQLFGTTQDITELKERELEIMDKEKELRSIADSAPIMIFKTDTNLIIQYVNGNPSKLLGSSIYSLFSPTAHAVVKCKIDQALSGEEVVHVEAQARPGNDKTTWYRSTIKKVQYGDKAPMLIFIVQDVTDLKEVEQRVFHAITESEERERQRIAADLHDSVGQTLAAVSLSLAAIERHLENDERLRRLANEAQMLVGHSIELTRNASHELMPPELQNLGFVEAVSALLDRLNRADSIRYVFSKQGTEVDLPPNLAINIYRIIQEFIRNSQKHSGASKVAIDIHFREAALDLTISDNGSGFDVKNIDQTRGIGLFNMVNRIRTFNGSHQYRSSRGKGVELRISLPLLAEKKILSNRA
jgi:PAS domain S-box-containing protein